MTLELEYLVRSSPKILFKFLSKPEALQEWFADEVNKEQDVFSFTWDGEEERAQLLEMKDPELIRFQWIDGERKGDSFGFRIEKDDLTGGVALWISDDVPSEKQDEYTLIWNAQIEALMKVLGS
ncbi:MAG: START-like domain-containing protein [Bacteroidetes bacterium]|nr:START-like domain-containing protein [Bacteroidota bacterium]MDA0931728.1 START-like domain-containing protein [Bacteroidota bacterium]